MPRKLIRGHAVMNIELDTPCVEIGKDNFTTASAVYFSDIEGQSLKLAKDYIKRNFPRLKDQKEMKLKIVEVTLSYLK